MSNTTTVTTFLGAAGAAAAGCVLTAGADAGCDAAEGAAGSPAKAAVCATARIVSAKAVIDKL
jgi:hypothetical protein